MAMSVFAEGFSLPQTCRMQETLLLLLVISAAVAVAMAWRIRQRSHARRQAIRAVLDAADALEARLRAAREEIEAMLEGVEENGEILDKKPVSMAIDEVYSGKLTLEKTDD